MIDSSYSMTLYDAIQLFQRHIIQNYGSESKTAQAYIRISNDLQRYAKETDLEVSPEDVIQEYYRIIVGVPAFEAVPSKSKERRERAVQMILDILNGKEPKRKYTTHKRDCPITYLTVIRKYETFMRNDQKSDGTVRTRSGRITYGLQTRRCSCSVSRIPDRCGCCRLPARGARRNCPECCRQEYPMGKNSLSYDAFGKCVRFSLKRYQSNGS